MPWSQGSSWRSPDEGMFVPLLHLKPQQLLAQLLVQIRVYPCRTFRRGNRMWLQPLLLYPPRQMALGVPLTRMAAHRLYSGLPNRACIILPAANCFTAPLQQPSPRQCARDRNELNWALDGTLLQTKYNALWPLMLLVIEIKRTLWKFLYS